MIDDTSTGEAVVDFTLVAAVKANHHKGQKQLSPSLFSTVSLATHLCDKAWSMFQSIDKYTRTEIANAALDDVTVEDPPKSDRMESLWTAETLKYFYLTFSKPDVISLDDYVL